MEDIHTVSRGACMRYTQSSQAVSDLIPAGTSSILSSWGPLESVVREA